MKSVSIAASMVFFASINVTGAAAIAAHSSVASSCPVATEVVASDTGPALGGADRDAICAIVAAEGAGTTNEHVAPNLDWENAFGVRYTDLAKMQAFYGAVVAPLQAMSSDATIEIKMRPIAADTAIADEYWHIVGQLDEVTHRRGADRWGRTTYVFTKTANGWVDILERVADLRAPYYRHYDDLPAPAALSNAALDAMAGAYELPNGRGTIVVTRTNDRFTVAYRKKTLTGIPVSATELLIFDASDLAEYRRMTFAQSGTTLSYDAGDITTPLTHRR